MVAFISLARVSRKLRIGNVRPVLHPFVHLYDSYLLCAYLKSALTLGIQRRTRTRPLLPGSRQGSTTVMEVLPVATVGAWKQRKGDQYGQSRSLLIKMTSA